MILSPGRRVDIVSYFKKALNPVGGKVITIDMSQYTAALYEGDRYYCVKKDFDNIGAYVDKVIEIGARECVKAVLTLIDPELSIISKYRSMFEDKGITPIISDGDIADVTMNKAMFYERFRNILPLVDTWTEKKGAIDAVGEGRLKFPLFVKPANGSGSAGIRELKNIDELNAFQEEGEYIFQPYAKKKEYGCDVYFDLISGRIKSVFIKEKIAMRSGETDKAISVHNDTILNILYKLEDMGFRGPTDVDIFEDFYGRYVINEINPRFGGGYPHAYNCGVDFINNIIRNLSGEEISGSINNYSDGIIMMKYNGLLFMDAKDLAEKNE